MSHLHSNYDTDSHFRIDPITRAITNQSSTKKNLIQYDHNSERFTFELPRHIEGHDMSLCDKVEVHYINIASNKVEKSADVYPVDDVQISSDDENVVIFSWLISGNATKYNGILSFLISFKCLTGDAVDYAWHTGICSEVSVGEGINNGEAVITKYSDVLEEWKKDIFEISPDDFVARMPAIDRKYIERGLVDETRYNAFREKHPNRIYVERYKDGEEYVYNKIALTGTPEPPEDFDKEDAGYMLDSIPMRLGGGEKDGEFAFRKGHIRVPHLSADEFPTEQEAGGFAIPRIYADTAILRNNTKRSIKKADTLDDKCLCVNSRENVSSNVSFYSGNNEHAYCVFKTALWWDCANAKGGDIEFILYDITKTLLFLCVIRPNLTGYIGKASSTGNKVDFDLKNILSFGKWAKIRIEYASSVRLYVNDFMIADTTLVNTTTNSLYMQVVSSKAISGNIALANVAFLTSAKKANVKGNHYFDLDNYTDIPTSDSSTGKKIIRWGDDVWHIEECEEFTGEGEFVVVNKKYLRKMLENVGGGGTNTKMYRHELRFDYMVETAFDFSATISFISTDSTPIDSYDMFLANADKIKTAEILTVRSFYYADISNPVEYYEVVNVEITEDAFNVHYRTAQGGSLQKAGYQKGNFFSYLRDTVTEV